jgi:acyl carrier protein
MVPYNETLILEAVIASLRGAGGLGDSPVRAGDRLKTLGLSRLRLLAAVIELEDEFVVEFPADAIDCFRTVSDIALYIQSHAMAPYEDPMDESPVADGHPIEWWPSIGDGLHRVCTRAFGRALGRVFGFLALAAG